MEYLLSILYTTIDSVCLFLFLGIFSVRRLPHRPFFEGCQFILSDFHQGFISIKLYSRTIKFQKSQLFFALVLSLADFYTQKFRLFIFFSLSQSSIF